MKKFTKDQIMFFVSAFVIVLLLAYKTIGFGFIINDGSPQPKYQSYIDSVAALEAKLVYFQDSNFVVKRDIFNSPNLRKVVLLETPVLTTNVVKVKKSYSYKLKVTPWDKDKLELLLILTVEGKAKISAANAVKLYAVGDQIQCASSVSVEVDESTGEPTGKTKDGGTVTGTITSIDKRNVYISLPGSNQAIRLNARDGAKSMDRDFVPQQSKDSEGENSGNSSGNAPKVKKQR